MVEGRVVEKVWDLRSWLAHLLRNSYLCTGLPTPSGYDMGERGAAGSWWVRRVQIHISKSGDSNLATEVG
jgi:hypothetical protein